MTPTKPAPEPDEGPVQAAEPEPGQGQSTVRFVPVPVPAEHVLEVMRLVLFRDTSEGEDILKLDAEHARVMLRDADETTRRIVLLVAKATAKDEPLRLVDLADAVGQDPENVRASLRKLNQEVLRGGRPVFQLRNEPTISVHGERGTKSYVSMRPDLAQVVRAAQSPAGG